MFDANTEVRVKAYNSPTTPDVFVFKTSVISSGGGVNNDYQETIYNATGYLTAGADLPATGSAAYAGGIELTDQLQNTASGDITLNVNLGTSNVSGHFSVADGLVIGPATFTFGDGVVTRNTDSSDFRGTLQSTDVTVTGSEIFGDFMGSQGKEIGGVVYVTTPDAALDGVFTATK
jgi:hypothetical protein